jgi:protein-S-isoprenylcysteine O-methyltransferase Ste14
MVMVLRQLLSIAILPFTVTVIIPRWIARRNAITVDAPHGVGEVAALVAGAAVFAGGIALFASSLYMFWTRGRGTLAPWDPPRRFVASGPYRYVRNPMISGVMLILVAEALVARSWPLAEWAAAFFAINLIYIPVSEEPMLEARFGESYRTYKHNVRMFLPRLRPWSGHESA